MKKNFIILASFISISFIFINCASKKNTTIDYSTYSINELTNKKTSLELGLNYALVNHYLEQIERDEVSHMALTKIDNGIVTPYWDNVPELKSYYNNWKDASTKIALFESKNAPELKELSSQYKAGKIGQDDYFRKNREIRTQLTNQYAYEYPQLSKNHINSLKTMWKQTGRYMLEDYKKREKEFPTYWIPEKDKESSKKAKQYKAIEKEIFAVQNEIDKKK